VSVAPLPGGKPCGTRLLRGDRQHVCVRARVSAKYKYMKHTHREHRTLQVRYLQLELLPGAVGQRVQAAVDAASASDAVPAQEHQRVCWSPVHLHGRHRSARLQRQAGCPYGGPPSRRRGAPVCVTGGGPASELASAAEHVTGTPHVPWAPSAGMPRCLARPQLRTTSTGSLPAAASHAAQRFAASLVSRGASASLRAHTRRSRRPASSNPRRASSLNRRIAAAAPHASSRLRICRSSAALRCRRCVILLRCRVRKRRRKALFQQPVPARLVAGRVGQLQKQRRRQLLRSAVHRGAPHAAHGGTHAAAAATRTPTVGSGQRRRLRTAFGAQREKTDSARAALLAAR
jgi:hypothetical protein